MSTSFVVLDYGSSVLYRGKPHVIRQESHDLATVMLYDEESGKLVEAKIEDLSPCALSSAPPTQDLAAINDEDWQEAKKIYDIIQPLLGKPNRTKADVLDRAVACNVHYVSIYRWIRQFESIGKVSVFLRSERKDKGKKLLSAEVEKIIADVIEAHYLSNQRWSPAKVCREIDRRCKRNKLELPHFNTIRNRLKRLDTYNTTKARFGTKAAEAEKLLLQGRFPGADVPLAVVQVDHTVVDIILVDSIHRQSIGRPWLTLLIDVCSRMILGFYISFDPPGNLSLGLCLAHAFMPKEKWLAGFGINTKWPCWGLPRTIHADNAKEFRGTMLQKACQEYGVNLEWRPVAKPRYGAHIERLLGTLNEEIHGLAGTTFSGIDEKGEYDSDGEATMSLDEFEAWFTHLCVDIYHQRPHSALGMPPIFKWQEGLLGTKKQAGIGVPARVGDERKLKLDLMPFETRTVQHYGIVWDHIEYQHDVLRRWVNEPDPANPKHKQKFLCRRDPRDISVIWFYDPEVCQYYAIPYRNTAHPAISIWELREAEKRVQAERPDVLIDENLIFQAYDKMQEIEESARKLTKKVRRNKERSRLGIASAREHLPASASLVVPKQQPIEPVTPQRTILPFDEVDDMQEFRGRNE
jgi:putative transposase